MKFFALALALLFTPSPASAEDSSLEMWLSWYDGVYVLDPSDQVKDGCWPSPAGTRAVVEKELLSLNVPLVSMAEASTAARIIVKGVGFTTRNQGEGYCAVNHVLMLWGSGGPEGGYSVPYDAEPFIGLYLQPKSRSQAYMDRRMRGDATQIAVAWVKSRKIREKRDKGLAAVIDKNVKTAQAMTEECRELAGTLAQNFAAFYENSAARFTDPSDISSLLRD